MQGMTEKNFVYCSPTPEVTWSRVGGQMSCRHRLESFGQQLIIDNVQLSDAGVYECIGINDMMATPVRSSLHLSVECKYQVKLFPN